MAHKYRVYFSTCTSERGESGGPKHAPHEIFCTRSLQNLVPILLTQQQCDQVPKL